MRGWLSIAAVVIAYDTWALRTGVETISQEYARAGRQHPLIIGATTSYLILHLCGIWPKRWDPFTGYARAIGA